MNLGELIDKRQALKAEVAAMTAAADAKQKEVDELERTIKTIMKDAGLEIAAGMTGKVAIRHETVPNVTNWGEFHEYIRTNNAFYLLQRRVTTTAFKEVIDSGETIPGVTAVPITKMSFTSI